MRTKLSLSLVVIVLLLATVSGANARFGATASSTAPQAAVGTGFTFQGQLKNAGASVNSNCDMTFKLYDAAATGVQIGSTITSTVPVSNSLFTVMLNTNSEYGANAFNGDARWLEVSAKCAGDVAFTMLTPRQLITAAPYAISAGTAMTATFATQADLLDGQHAAAFQSRVSGNCAVGSAIRVVNADGTVSCTPTGTLDSFQAHTAIATSDALDWETFTIGSDTYLAVTNAYNGSSYSLDSKIYRWSGTQFIEFQAIPTQGAYDWEPFIIGGDAYLAVANAGNGSTNNIDSKIYRWNGTQFVEFQAIPTHSAVDWAFFTIGGDAYLAVANRSNGSTYNIDSVIYRWNGTQFVEFQAIPTQGAFDWESFTIGSDTFLAVANGYNNSTYNLDSKIYRWNGAQFVEFQAIPTQGIPHWESFTIGGDTYLAAANAYNGSNYNLDSKIYRWNGTQFVEFQSVPTQGAYDWEHFTIGSDAYLIVANSAGATYNLDSKIYRWNGAQFVEFQAILTHGAGDWEFFTIGSDAYLAVANSSNGSTNNIDSQIYKADLLLGSVPQKPFVPLYRPQVLDLTAADPDLRGFYGGFTDGRYGYFVPFNNTVNFGKVARVDLQNYTTSGVTVLDLASVDPELAGFVGGFTDGRYGYFVPAQNAVCGPCGKVARVDLQNFVTNTVTVLDLAATDPAMTEYRGGFTDGRYAYFVPNGWLTPHGKIARVDLNNFTAGGLTSLDLTTVDPTLTGFHGGFTDGRYGYFVPASNGAAPSKLVRVDLQTFSASGVTILDLATFDPALKGFPGGFTDGRYGYLYPHYDGTATSDKLVRIDLQNFTPNGLTTLDLRTVDPTLNHFNGGFTDEHYAYLVPNEMPSVYGKFVRVDLDDFTTTGVTVLDLTATDPGLQGFHGGFSDGRYGYLVPFNNGTFSGKVARIQLFSGAGAP